MGETINIYARTQALTRAVFLFFCFQAGKDSSNGLIMEKEVASPLCLKATSRLPPPRTI